VPEALSIAPTEVHCPMKTAHACLAAAPSRVTIGEAPEVPEAAVHEKKHRKGTATVVSTIAS
jgi:hypothetical protein